MIKFLLALVSILLIPSSVAADWEPASATALNEKWMHGDKMEVVNYAEKRLQKDQEDLLGLLIKWDYAISFMDQNGVYEFGPRLKRAVAKQNSGEFSKRKAWLVSDVDTITKIMGQITPEMAKAEAYKGKIAGKPMDILRHITDLEADGYFNQAAAVKPQPSVSIGPGITLTPPIHVSEKAASAVPDKSTNLGWWIVVIAALGCGAYFILRKPRC